LKGDNAVNVEIEIVEGMKMNLKHEVYERAYNRLLKKYAVDSGMDAKVTMKKLLFLGVKKLIARPERESFTREEAESDFSEAQIIMAYMRLLTPKEFMQLFPVEKDFKGHKWHFKDYFYTQDYIRKLPQGEPIGDEVLHFMWEYTNWDITEFNVYVMGCISNLRRLEGKTSLAEEWANINGLKTYTMHKDSKGREFLFDKETGKTTRVRRKVKHIKVVK